MASPRLWALGLAALPLVACKAKTRTDEPGHDVRSWTLAEIEAELSRNDQALAGEGIMVAMASPPAYGESPTAAPAPTVEPELEPAAEDVEPDSGGAAVEPVAPQPMPTTEPTSAYEAETRPPELASAGDAPHERTSRRRMSSRSRREATTRCERVCGLAEATCELQTQICELAARHPDEPRYAQACARAEQQCVAASEACQRCEE